MPVILPLLLGCAAGATPPAEAPDAPAGPKGVDAADVPNGACAWPLPFDATSPSFTTSIADLDGDGAVDTVVEQSDAGSGGGVRWRCVRDGSTGTAACDEAEWWVYSPFSAGRRLANPGRDGQALRLLDAIEARRALLEPRKPPSDGSPGLAVEPARRLRLDAADPALAGLFALASPPPTQGTWSPPLRWYRGPAAAQAGAEFSARELPRFSAAPAWSDEPGAPWTASYTASPSGRGMAAFFSASAPPPPPSAVTIGPMTVRVLGDAVVAEVGAERHAWLATGGGAGHVERCTPWTADDFPQVGPDGGCGPGDVADLTELARADFDGDGVEDVLLEIEAAPRGACWALAWVVVATRRAPDGLLVPVAASWAVRSG